MIRNMYLSKLLPVLFFLTLLAMLELFATASRFSLLPDSYYYVYERSINAVIANGHLEILRNTFDNFASSPGTIILNCFLVLIPGLDIPSLSFIEGLMIFLLLFLFAFIWLRNLYHNFDYALGIFSLIIAGFTAVFLPMLTYGSHAYLLLLLILSFPFSRLLNTKTLSVAPVIVLVISVTSMVVEYLPVGIYMLASMLLFLMFMAVLRTDLKHIKLLVLVSLIVISMYYVYMGQFFFEDFNFFIHTIVENLKFEQLQYTRRTVAIRMQYDQVYSFLYPLSFLRFVLVFLILLYFFLILFMKRKIEISRQLMALNLLGALLYIIGVAIYVLVSTISDYGARIISVSYSYYLTTVYSTLLYIKLNKEKGSRLFSILRVAIVLFTTLSALGAILTPIARIYYEVKGFDLSTQYKYGEEGLWTSTFINNKLNQSMLNKVSGTYRYIYLFSRYGIPYTIFNTGTNIRSLANIDSLIVIPMDIIEKSDASFGPISRKDFLELVFAKNIILNTGFSVILR